MSQPTENPQDEAVNDHGINVPEHKLDGVTVELLLDKLVVEFSKYQSNLERGEVNGGAVLPSDLTIDAQLTERPLTGGDSRDREPPQGLKAILTEGRRFLDLLHQVQAAKADQETKDESPAEVDSDEGKPNGKPELRRNRFSVYAKPSHIGRYEILRQVGSGGFGIVFQGLDPHTKRDVAIKVPRPEMFVSQDLIDRFKREAIAVGQFEHPNIVPVYDSDVHGVTPYIVSKFINGPTLSNWRSVNRELSHRVAAEIVRQLALGVAHAHERGVLHRDLKPGNVMLAPCGEGAENCGLSFTPMLTDFGMAKLVEIGSNTNRGQITRTGAIIGTLGYMAPEQSEGRNRDITARSDVYGLGAILYELLVGVPPFQGENDIQTLQNIIRNDPLSRKFKESKVPLDLAVICLKALEKQPDQRFGAAKELADELERYLMGMPIVSRPIHFVERCRRWCQRRPAFAGMISLLFGGALAFGWFVIATNSAKQRDLANHNRELEEQSRQSMAFAEKAARMQQLAEENARQARDTAYASDIGRVAAAWRMGDSRTMTDVLDRHIPKEGEEDRRGFEWWYLRRQITIPGHLLLDTGSAVYVLRQISTGELMAASGADSTVRFFKPETGEIWKQINTGQGEINGTAFYSDEKLATIATAGDDGTVRVLNYETGEERLRIVTALPKVYGVRVTADGAKLIACGTAPFICVFDAESGSQLFRLEGHKKTVQNIELLPGNLLVSNSNDGSLRFWDLDSGKSVGAVEAPQIIGPVAVTATGNGKFVAVGTSLGAVLVIDAESKAIRTDIPLADRVSALAFDPSGTRLAIGDDAGRISIRLVSQEGQLGNEELAAWQGHLTAVSALRWRTNGNGIMSAGREGKVYRWDVSDAVQRRLQRSLVTAGSGTGPFSRRPQNVFLRPEVLQRDNQSVQLPPRMPGRLYRQFCFSSDERYLAVVTEDEKLELFLSPADPDAPIDQNRIATWNSLNRTRIIGFTSDSNSLAVVEFRDDAVEDLQLSSDIVILRLPSLEESSRLPVKMVKPLSAMSDGRRIAFSMADQVCLWDIARECMIWQAEQQKVFLTSFSPDGTLVAASDRNRLIVVRNSRDGTVRMKFTKEPSRTNHLLFSPDGKTLISTSTSTIRFSHIATGQELLEFPTAGTVHRIEYSPDGKRLICQSTPKRKNEGSLDEIEIFDASEVSNR